MSTGAYCPIIALTGGLGSGKSTAAKILASLGFSIVDADALARQVTSPQSSALKEIAKSFGQEVINQDGTLNRTKLGQIVFADPAKRQLLESILHPRIRQLAREELLSLRQKHYPAIYDVPLFFEAHLDNMLLREDPSCQKQPNTTTKDLKSYTDSAGSSEPFFNGSLVIAAPRDLCIERACQRDGLSRQQAEARLLAQLPIEEKVKRATWVIYNTGSIEHLATQLKTWAMRLG